MSAQHESAALGAKHVNEFTDVETATFADHARGRQFSVDAADRAMVQADQNKLHRNLKGRHMQMIAMYGRLS